MGEKLTAVFNNKIWIRITGIAFPVVLFLFAMLHIGEGMPATDTGYNYGNFRFFDGLDDMWKFSTYLANVVGAFFTKLPFGETMLGMNFYTGLFKALAALVTYFLCVRVCKMSRGLVFFAQMLALGFCWCPTALLYNYMTYFLFTLGALFVFQAFKAEKSRYLVLAGVCLGLNVMVRLPNVAEAALIVCVWFGGIVYKKEFKKILQDTLWCMLGYLGSVGVIFLYIVVRYGLHAYVEGIQALFAMTENATSYSTMSMLLDSFRMYLAYSKWVMLLAGIMACGIIGFAVFKGKFLLLKKIGVAAAVGGYVFIAYLKGMYTLNYRNYTSMFFWGVLFLIIALFLCAYAMFFAKCGRELKLLASMAAVIIFITPIGSNNHLYSPMNNLFLVAPVVFSVIRHLLYEQKRVMIGDRVEISTYPIAAMLVGLVSVVLLQSVCFGASFVFRDGTEGEKRVYKVENNAVLAGMRTTEQNAENLQGLNDYLTGQALIGERVLLYGNVPSLAFYFSLEPAISSTWPDLESFSHEKFTEEIDLLETQDLPIVITDAVTYDSLLMYDDATYGESNGEKKLEHLQAFLKDNGYCESYRNAGFVVYKSE